jgi:hypothetical protein
MIIINVTNLFIISLIWHSSAEYKAGAIEIGNLTDAFTEDMLPPVDYIMIVKFGYFKFETRFNVRLILFV